MALLALACSSKGPSASETPTTGASDFVSAAPGSGQGLAGPTAGSGTGAGESADPSVPSRDSAGGSSAPRTVEETDIYKLEGDRLYYLNGYRGLMVFDVSDVDHPRFLGRSPIYGTPEQMTVHDGMVDMVVSDWYGKMDDGTPFHGSIVRGIDATDPANMRLLGEALLGGNVRDTRVVGDVIYAVTEKYPWDYGWYGGVGVATSGGVSVGGPVTTTGSGAQVSVTSVSFEGGHIQQVDHYDVPGQNGIFYVTASSILLASAELGTPDQYGYAAPTGNTNLSYVDIADPNGAIQVRGTLTFPGYINGWGTDNGRWNIDFADGTTAHALACGQSYCGNGQPLVLATADFSDADHPKLVSSVNIPGNTWQPAVRFDGDRMYLSPADGYAYSPNGVANTTTPIQIFDLSDPAAPVLKSSVDVTGSIWNFTPAGDRVFALGSRYSTGTNTYGSEVTLSYLDVSDLAHPMALGTAAFGQGWAWTPAAGTFKAFTKSDSDGLVVLPFSGYSNVDYKYNNGLQLIEFTPTTIATSGTAHTKGWTTRGIFVKNRLVSLSDLSLAVIDYTDHAEPSVVTELTLARNVVDAKPQGDGTVAELSSDWWGNDVTTSELRILDADAVEETSTDATLASLNIPGVNARVFHDGSFSYVTSDVSRMGPCPDYASKGAVPGSADGGGAVSQCQLWHTRVSVVDRSEDPPRLRGSVDLPENTTYGGWGWGWGYWGCYPNDWYYGSTMVQVNGHVLAFQSWEPVPDDTTGRARQVLNTVNLADADHPVLGTTTVVDNADWWWGNLRPVRDQLYASHYEWVEQPSYTSDRYDPGTVKYYVDRIDLSQPEQPSISARINVPGVLVGAAESDPNLIYTIDYRWYDDSGNNELAVSRIEDGKAFLQGSVEIPGYVGNVIVRGTRAYFTVQEYATDASGLTTTSLKLYEANLDDPAHPSLTSSTPSEGWGWLLDVQGDRAFVTSGFGQQGVDVFKLTDDAAPAFDQFVRVRGWYPGSLARENQDLYFATGYWGTEHVTLK